MVGVRGKSALHMQDDKRRRREEGERGTSSEGGTGEKNALSTPDRLSIGEKESCKDKGKG
jgi:hypothetical protein